MAATPETTNGKPLGRRARKKAATRKMISDIATAMFLERGFDEVSVREIADRADVSPTTVFAYFPQKEALVFDEDASIGQELVDLVRNRKPGQSIIDALHNGFRDDILQTRLEHGDQHQRFMALVDSSPSLNDYAQRVWLRYTSLVADEISKQVGLEHPNDQIALFSHFALQVQLLASRSDRPEAVLDAGFDILRQGWSEPAPVAKPTQ